jgi:hypothetical protein
MIYFEDNAREALLEYLNKPKKKLELPCGKGTVLKKYKKDNIGSSIYIIDDDGDGVVDTEIEDSIEPEEDFKNITDIKLYKDKKLKEKYIVIFNNDFPVWIIKALSQIGKQPSDYGFQNQKGKFHIQIREKDRKAQFKNILIDLNKNNSSMLQILKSVFIKINHKE